MFTFSFLRFRPCWLFRAPFFSKRTYMVGDSMSKVERARTIALRQEKIQMNEISTRLGRHCATVFHIVAARGKCCYFPKTPPWQAKKDFHKDICTYPACSDETSFYNILSNKEIISRTVEKWGWTYHSDRLRRDLNLSASKAAPKPLLTKAMNWKRLVFCK